MSGHTVFSSLVRKSAPEVLDAKPNISSQKDFLSPNRTLKRYQQRTQMHTFKSKSPKTAQIMIPKTKTIKIFLLENPVCSRLLMQTFVVMSQFSMDRSDVERMSRLELCERSSVIEAKILVYTGVSPARVDHFITVH